MSPTLPQRPLRVQSDARLAELVRSSGEARAFEALVRRHRKPLLGYCRRLSIGDAQAEDVLQQGLLQAWRALRRGDEVGDVKGWLYRIVHNAALDALRRPGRDHVELDELRHGPAVRPTTSEHVERRLAVRDAMAGLAALPEMQREALVRTAVHGDTHEQVASALGLSHAAVRGLVHRARATMRAAALALVPARAIHWAERSWPDAASGLGAATGGADTGLAGGAAAGMLGALAKGTAILASGGVLATGLAVAHRGHARAPRAPSASLGVARPLPPAGATLLAAVAAPAGGRSARSAEMLARRPDRARGLIAPAGRPVISSIRLAPAAPASPPGPVLGRGQPQTAATEVPAASTQLRPAGAGAPQSHVRGHGGEDRDERRDRPPSLTLASDGQDGDTAAGDRHGSDGGAGETEAGRVPVADQRGDDQEGADDASGARTSVGSEEGRGSGRESPPRQAPVNSEHEAGAGAPSGSSEAAESSGSAGSREDDDSATAESGSQGPSGSQSSRSRGGSDARLARDSDS